jgi:lipopolysaccharide heptosyltransferase II
MKILIRLPNWLGDVVMSTALIGAVRQCYPNAQVDVVVKKELSDICTLIPGLSNIYSFSKKENKGLPGVYRFGKALRMAKYDIFFNLPKSFSSAVMAWATGAKKRVGFNNEGGFFLLTNHYKKPKNVHRVDEYISLLEQYTGKLTGERKVALELNHHVARVDHHVLINFNSEASSRRMPVEKARDILNRLTYQFKKVHFSFIGSAKECAFIENIIDNANNKDRVQNLAGKTDLVELSRLMGESTAILTTDSGPAHMANALGTPVIVLFGAGNEHNTAPYNKQKLNILRYGKLDCEPCLKNTCKLYGVPKCLQLIDELSIIANLARYLMNEYK